MPWGHFPSPLDMHPRLPPPDDRLNIDALAKVFGDRAGSYKFLWAFAIIKEAQEQTGKWTPFSRLCKSMLLDSRVPINRFKLHFGLKDQMADKWRRISGFAPVKTARALDDLESEKPEVLQKIYRELCEKVPHRWLSPFFKEELARLRNPTNTESVPRNKIIQCARDSFDGASPPPYKLDGKGIVLHPLWRAYFKRNAEIARGWALWHWINYLQRHNPTIPGIVEKIAFPDGRGELTQQQNFWRDAIKHGGNIDCVYSETPVNARAFHLDHYIPWSFIGHDHIWNLAPVMPRANSQKGDKLPHSRYFKGFVAAHHRALMAWHHHFPRKHADIIDSYRAGLHIEQSGMLNESQLRAAYKRVVLPFMEIAKANSFQGDWRYNPRHQQEES